MRKIRKQVNYGLRKVLYAAFFVTLAANLPVAASQDNLNQTLDDFSKEYGEINASNEKYYHWEIQESGNNLFTETKNNQNYNIKYSYNDKNLLESIDNSEDLSSTDINGVFLNIRGIINREGGKIGDINADFIENTSPQYNFIIHGAAIYNDGTIGNIKGNFIGNKLDGLCGTMGAAIYNTGTIGDITGDFIGNNINSKPYQGYGGAIYNSGIIGNIKGNFIGNSNYSNTNTDTWGGAILNEDAKIASIDGDFIGNYSFNDTNYLARGGAIASYRSNINYIKGNFIENYTRAGKNSYGGAIHNSGTTINEISANFINNYAYAEEQYANGGAFSSLNSTISKINSNFTKNYSQSTNGSAYGGAIYSQSTLENISGNFTGNHASGKTAAQGGAIYNFGTIGTQDENNQFAGGIINSTFNDNYVKTEQGTSEGGAIYNSGTITNIIANFNNNSSQDFGGAIANIAANSSAAIINNIEGNFTNNSTDRVGGAIYVSGNESKISNISGLFKSNYIDNKAAEGGAIALRDGGSIENLNSSFYNNYANGIEKFAKGGAIEIFTGSINNINGDFVKNRGTGVTGSLGGAIYQYNGNINSITGNFVENSAFAPRNVYGGAIMSDSSTIGSIKANFSSNNASVLNENVYGGAIAAINNNEIKSISGNFTGNYAETGNGTSQGGAIYNAGTIGSITNSTFQDNYAKATEGSAQGGAIYTTKDLNIISDNGVSEFRGNYTQVGKNKDDNAIYLDNAKGTLNFQLKNNGQIIMADNIRGAVTTDTQTVEDGTKTTIINHYNVNIEGDNNKNTVFHMLNDIHDADVTVGNTTLNTVNNAIHTYNFNSLTINSDTNLLADVDLANSKMDRFTSSSYGEHSGKINVVGMNLLSDAAEAKTEIYFAETGLKDIVSNGTSKLPDHNQTTAYTPIYKYTVNYDNREDGGYFVFSRGAGGSNPSDAYNPSVLSAPISSVAASQATINETFKYVFEHADAFTKMPEHVRQAKINTNKYALSTDFNHNLGSLCPEHNNKAGWYKPYVTFEKMDLKNGPKVNATTYGSLAGFDTDFFEHKNGWHSVGTGYVGYNGSQLRYKGIDTTMNGGILGYTHTMYKGNFWSALTLSAGASVGQSNTMYGKEDFTSLLAGVGSKTGYNFEFKEGKYILQPIMFLSYTFVNTFDYTNAAGVRINADPAHSIQLNPSIRFITNTKTGWQPYASVGMVWNVMNENKVSANNVRLPEMSMKPYVEYGVGVQKNWKDRFTAFGQAMLRNGGRTGIALTGGFRWAIGHEGKPLEKVQSDGKLLSSTGERKILKQMSASQKYAYGKRQNTTRTVNTGILKQL